MTQNERIIRHLKDYGSITSFEALNEYGIMRLASRICDLKAKGYDIRSELKKSVNRYGEPVRYAVYEFKDGKA